MSHIPFGVVNLRLRAQKLLLTLLVGVVATDLVTVFLGLEERCDVQTRPHLLPSKLTNPQKERCQPLKCSESTNAISKFIRSPVPRIDRNGAAIVRNVPLLADTVEVAVEAVDHDSMHTEHVMPWLEAAGRDIPL